MSNLKFKFNIKKEKFSEFVEKISDLTQISDVLKMKIDTTNILVYSTLGTGVMLAFKNFLLKTDEYFDIPSNLEEYESCDIIIANANKWVKNISFLKENANLSLNVMGKLDSDTNIVNARSFELNSDKLKIKWLGAESFQIREITKNILEQRLNLKNRKWDFYLSSDEFNNVKKLSNINSEKIIYVQVSDNKVKFSEVGAWELEIESESNMKQSEVILNKRFLKSIKEDGDGVTFNMFDTFILIKDEESNLMLSYEQNFNDEDI
jgi:hypothetical protein